MMKNRPLHACKNDILLLRRLIFCLAVTSKVKRHNKHEMLLKLLKNALISIQNKYLANNIIMIKK